MCILIVSDKRDCLGVEVHYRFVFSAPTTMASEIVSHPSTSYTHSTRAFSIGRRSAAQPGSGPSVFVLWMFVWMSHDKSTFCVVYCHRRRRRRHRRLCGGHAERAHARAPHTHHNARLYAITCPRVRVVKLCVFFGRLRVAVIVVGDGNCRPCCVHN